ncbi:MAG: hypothetical protein ACO2PK_13115 [Armatimonadota bacterium]
MEEFKGKSSWGRKGWWGRWKMPATPKAWRRKRNSAILAPAAISQRTEKSRPSPFIAVTDLADGF